MRKEISLSLGLTQQYAAPSSWWEHVPIAHWLVENLKPAIIVELGTHYGVSFFSFCEAAKAYSPNSFIYAVDTWEGDAQAGFYNSDVYERVRVHHEAYHQERSRLIRSSFDDAAEHFPNGGIDIIHIDGLHTYEAVSHDYKVWRSKLKEGGTLLFHDCNVREGDFGVWRLWQEIRKREDMQCIEVMNGHGLGIATLARQKPEWHSELEGYLTALRVKGGLLNNLARLREQLESTREELMISERHSENLNTIVRNREEELKGLMQQIEKSESDKKLLMGEIEYLRRGTVRRIFDRVLRICKKDRVQSRRY
jgi:hypothetical protein